jgi:hypothetical protein
MNSVRRNKYRSKLRNYRNLISLHMSVIHWLRQPANSVHGITSYKGSELLFCIAYCYNDVNKNLWQWLIHIFFFRGLFNEFSVSTQQRVGWQDDSRGLFEVMFRNFLGRTKENLKNPVSIVDVDSNRAPPEYKSTASPLEQAVRLDSHYQCYAAHCTLWPMAYVTSR